MPPNVVVVNGGFCVDVVHAYSMVAIPLAGSMGFDRVLLEGCTKVRRTAVAGERQATENGQPFCSSSGTCGNAATTLVLRLKLGAHVALFVGLEYHQLIRNRAPFVSEAQRLRPTLLQGASFLTLAAEPCFKIGGMSLTMAVRAPRPVTLRPQFRRPSTQNSSTTSSEAPKTKSRAIGRWPRP